jgi:4-amino-4-deoxy-L-arabinose transferase-like glycosyltransferase
MAQHLVKDDRTPLSLKHPVWWLVLLALAVRSLTAWPLRQPGYTDAYYYAVGAEQLYAGEGFSEPFVWNYLDPPDGLPHPGYLYWMPLTAVLGWLGMVLGGDSFRAMQAPFVLISALLPLVAYEIAWDLTGRRKHAVLAGVLAVFPGFYAHVLVLPDNFAPFALAGSLCLWAAGRGLRDGHPGWFGLAGLAAGFGHLARADGLLLAGIALLAALLPARGSGFEAQAASNARRPRSKWAMDGVLLVLAGYLVVMGPWFARNWQVFGTPLPDAGARTLFLTDYDDMFAYGRPLAPASYLDWGWTAILSSKGQALLLNLQRLWVEGLLIFLLPFALAGLWRFRRERLLWPFLLYLPLLFLVMTFAFTFPGTRGGLYHSGAALLPFFFAATGPGLERLLSATARRFRGWHVKQAWRVFGVGLVALAALVTVLAMGRGGVLNGDWNRRNQDYEEIGHWLAQEGAGTAAVVMVGDAPGFTWHTGYAAIAVPNEPLDTVVLVARRYGARFLVLDSFRPRTTDALYAGEVTDPRLAFRYAAGPEAHPTIVYEVLR